MVDTREARSSDPRSLAWCTISAGRFDTVVVYKIDWSTRSLPDFVRLIEIM